MPEVEVRAKTINGWIQLKTRGKLHNRHDGVVVRASALQSVDLGFIP